MSQSSGSSIAPLIAAAAGLYLFYRYMPSAAPMPAPAGGDGTVPPSTTTPPASTTPSAPAPSLPAPPPVNQPTPSTAPLPASELEAIARQAATGNDAAVQKALQLNILYDSDQWNWLRAAGGGGQTTADLFPPGDRNYQMNVREYLSRRQQHGLSGFGGGWRRSLR